jgi:hypothetical protein
MLFSLVDTCMFIFYVIFKFDSLVFLVTHVYDVNYFLCVVICFMFLFYFVILIVVTTVFYLLGRLIGHIIRQYY